MILALACARIISSFDFKHHTSYNTSFIMLYTILSTLEIVITRAAPAFHKLFMIMGCVFDINTVYKTVEKLTFQAFY